MGLWFQAMPYNQCQSTQQHSTDLQHKFGPVRIPQLKKTNPLGYQTLKHAHMSTHREIPDTLHHHPTPSTKLADYVV